MSINPAINNLKETLQNDSALAAFCHAQFGRQLTVKRGYRDREEIGMDECPIIIITRPSVDRENGLNRRSRGIHSLRLYFGFYQGGNAADVRDQAAETAIEFEELIESSLVVDVTRAGTASATVPGASVNDEGALHPIYFGVMEVMLQKRL